MSPSCESAADAPHIRTDFPTAQRGTGDTKTQWEQSERFCRRKDDMMMAQMARRVQGLVSADSRRRRWVTIDVQCHRHRRRADVVLVSPSPGVVRRFRVDLAPRERFCGVKF